MAEFGIPLIQRAHEVQNNSWCIDFAARPQTILLPRVVVFAPDPRHYGLCITLMEGDPKGADAFIYLAPSLERLPQSDVDFTVAHEFAHAELRHHEPESENTFSIEEAEKGYLNWDSEIAADDLVAAWGYKIPKRRKRKRQ
jgi:hypothetical protein